MWRLLCALLAMSGWALPATVQEPGQCAELQRMMDRRGVEADSGDPAPGSGACGNSTPCCSLELQQHGLQQLVRRDLRRMLGNNTAAVQELLLAHASDVQGAILRVIHEARENTLETFQNSYSASAGMARQPIHKFFGAFSRYFQSQLSDPELEEAVNEFFDALFPVAYRDALAPTVETLPESLASCLRRSRLQLRPFHDAPLHMKEKLLRVFGTAKFYLQAVYVGVEVLNTATEFEYSPSCYDGMMRHDVCALCHGVSTAIRPCMGLCYNVMHGCIAPLTSLSQTWESYVNALARLSTSLQQSNNVKSYLFKMNRKMTEAMINVWENKEQIQLRVSEACGGGGEAPASTSTERSRRRRREQPVLPYSRSGDLQLTLPERQQLSLQDAEAVPLLSHLSVFNGQIELHRDLFKKLPDATCTGGAMHEQGQCWNGRSVGSYGERLAGLGLESQAFNPEVTVPSQPDPIIEEKSDRLDRIRQIALDKLMSAPSSDSLHNYPAWNEGSGSGAWQNEYDDEDGLYEYYDYDDYGEGGSGSGAGIDDEDMYPDGDDLAPESDFTEPTSERGGDQDMEIEAGTEQPQERPEVSAPPAGTTAAPDKPKKPSAAAASAPCAALLVAALLAVRL